MKVIVVGGFIETLELCEDNGITIVGVIDKVEIPSYTNLGKDENAEEIYNIYKNVKIIISPDQPPLRKKLVKFYNKIGFEVTSLISKRARLSKSCKVKNGVYIQDNVNISANADIGNYVRINVGANIMHDAVIGDFTTIAPNAVILGRVSIGENCYIGANATILPEIKIGNNCVIGAGAVVTKNVENNTTVKGVPAK